MAALQTVLWAVAFGAALLALLVVLAGILGLLVLVSLFLASLVATVTLVAVVIYALLGGFDERAAVSYPAPLPARS